MPTEEVQFGEWHQWPISANVTADGWSSTGLDFGDFGRMCTQRRKQSGLRRLATPEWALNPEKLRPLIVRVMELRACFKYPQPGTDSERLARAQKFIDLYLPKKTATLNRMCQRFVALKKDPTATREQLEKLSRQIETMDSEICVLHKPDRGAEILAGIVHHYYGACLDSVGVATELGIKPPAVRRTLWSMHRVWERMQKPVPTYLVLCEKCGLYIGRQGHRCFFRDHEEKRTRFCVEKRTRFCVVCGKELPKHHSKFCGDECYRKDTYDKQKLKRKESPQTRNAFCSPECKATFASPTKSIDAKGFDAATVDLGDRFYETYLQFCARLNTAPMPFCEWAARR